MSQAVTAQLKLALAITETLTIGESSGPLSETDAFNLALANGTGANSVNRKWSKTSTPAASTPDTWTLSSLTDDLSRTVVLTKVRVFLLVNNGTGSLIVGGAALHPWQGPFGATTDKITVNPGGCVLLVAPDVNGYAVTSGSSDQLEIDPGATAGNYLIAILGE